VSTLSRALPRKLVPTERPSGAAHSDGLAHHAHMTRLRRPLNLTLALIAAMLLALFVSFALGADSVSLLLGGAIVATAMALVVGAWVRPLRRDQRARQRRNELKARRRARRTRDAVHDAERRLFSQLEALAWLRDELRFKTPLPPTRGAAAAPDALLELVRIIDRSEATSVVELGSGVSTIVCARRLQQAGHGHVVALEHMPEYAAATRAEIAAHGLEEFATVVDAPLVEVQIGDGHWSWYEIGPGVPDHIDTLFVDGPPMLTGPLARYPALPLLQDRLTPGAVVFLDDGDRPDEREMVRRWQAEIGGFEVRHLEFAKGAWLMTMPR
jgi:predicted O-methyltransferase YrrM